MLRFACCLCVSTCDMSIAICAYVFLAPIVSMLVRVSALSGEQWRFDLPRSSSAWDLKREIKRQTGIEKRKQHLLVGNSVVSSKQPLSSTGADLSLIVSEPFCSICGSAVSKLCSGCNDILYCSSNCQRLDWPRHKLHCKSCRLG